MQYHFVYGVFKSPVTVTELVVLILGKLGELKLHCSPGLAVAKRYLIIREILILSSIREFKAIKKLKI